jgi:hypothetical protein
MKKIFLVLLFFGSISYGQTKGISYQALILDPVVQELPGFNNNQVPLANKNICLKFSIIDELDLLEYEEIFTITTDDVGMVNLIIGTGTSTGGYASSFKDIAWSALTKSLEVDLSIKDNCTDYEKISIAPFTAVPFALFAVNTQDTPLVLDNETEIILLKSLLAATQTGAGLNTDGTYTANTSSNFINSVTSLKGADTALDSQVKNNEDAITSNKTAIVTNAVNINTKVSISVIVDDLTTGGSAAPLSAEQGKVLKTLLDTTVIITVEDNLTSRSATNALSANQGRELKGLTDTNTSDITDLETEKLAIVNDLSDLADTTTARINLGLGTAATTNATDYATATQGETADTALQTASNLTDLADTATARTNLGLANVDNTTDLLKPVSTATQTELDSKENTRNKSTSVAIDASSDVKFPSVKSVKTYVDSAISNANTTNANLIGPVTSSGNTTSVGSQTGTGSTFVMSASPTFTGTVLGITKGMVSLANVDNTTDADKPISTATITELNLKANLASPTFTGTVSGITSTMIGMANVDNTTDLLKPVSNATETELNLKENTGNKSTSVATDAASDVKFPSVKSVKTYVDTEIINGTATNVSGVIAVANGGTGATTATAGRKALGIYAFRFTLSGGSTTENINLTDLISEGHLPSGYIFTGTEIITATLNKGTSAVITSVFPASVTLNADLDVLRINSTGANLPNDEVSIIIIPL